MTAAEAADDVTIVRFDRPPVNAIDLDLLDVIIATMRNVEGPVVITGAGRCFSAGVDLRALVDGGAAHAGEQQPADDGFTQSAAGNPRPEISDPVFHEFAMQRAFCRLAQRQGRCRIDAHSRL